MNAGLANLHSLKSHLLAPSLVAGTEFDTVLANIGLGVAAQFEKFCNRCFLRTASAVEIFPADYSQFILARTPVESISAIALKQTEALGFVAQTVNDFIRTFHPASGVVYLTTGDAGTFSAQIKFTYTGGYFWNILEPADSGYPTALPSGATALPEDLKLAWLQQCTLAWQVKDKLGADITTTGSAAATVAGSLAGLEFLPDVKRTLTQYVHMQLV